MTPSLKHPGFLQRKKTESNSTGHFASPGSFHPHPCHTRSARVFLSEYLGLFAKNSGVGRKANIFSNLNSDVVFFPGRSWFVTMLSLEGRKTDDNFGWLVVPDLRPTCYSSAGARDLWDPWIWSFSWEADEKRNRNMCYNCRMQVQIVLKWIYDYSHNITVYIYIHTYKRIHERFKPESHIFSKKNVSPLQSIAFHGVLSAQEIARQGRVLSRRWRPTDLKRYTRGKGPGQKWGGMDSPKFWEFCPLNLACESEKNLENQLLLISINLEPPKTSHSCLKKWYTRFSRKIFFWHFTNGAFCQPKAYRVVESWDYHYSCPFLIREDVWNLYFLHFFCPCSLCLVSRNSIFLYFSTVFVVYSDLDDAHPCSKFFHFKTSTASLRVVGSTDFGCANFCLPYVPRTVPRNSAKPAL